MIITLALNIIGADGAERWCARVTYDRRPFTDCCADGHETPEDAAAHGALLAAQALSRDARALKPPAIGALILARAS